MAYSRNLLITLTFLVFASGAQTQNLDRDLTDPEAIAQECGGDANAGKPIFQAQCSTCHALTPEAQTASAPHLGELYGRASGGLDTYAYSPAMSQTLVVWEGESLHQFLAGDLIPGHPVVIEEQARRDVLTYLRTETRPAPPDFADITVPASLLSMQADADYGEYLASDCAACHNAGAQSSGNYNIAGRSRAEFLHLMLAYRARALPNPIMQMTAARLSDDELVALAEYFSSLNPPSEGG
jgi:cytochrome c